MLMISVDTFDTWLRAGFIPPPAIERGQIIRWHWPSLEEHLLERERSAPTIDPSVEGARRAVEAWQARKRSAGK
ncbi:hypothetical protein [Bosea sp. 685]|uniref:hypothetical protein n=1 Tax=Bosea sp. 685 TaxID=3080057 RepID=UPI002892F80F|nr:hypothetical protein [Bosea sp. 685]WNJ91108.1 hypothetical protein RMR04_02030 [Bosea sp. 685]